MLEFSHVKYHYKKGPDVLKDVSFSLDKGDCLCLLGPNGTGKTTLLKCLFHYYEPDAGEITLDGKRIRDFNAKERAKELAYVAQSTRIAFPYTVREMVLMGRTAHLSFGSSYSEKDREIAEKVMERLEISFMAEKCVQNLSGGECQMVMIARALAQQAKYLVLDEPTAALDYSNQIKILKILWELSEDGYGILMTTHFPDHAFLVCNKTLLMKHGKVSAFGTPDEVVNSENLTRLYDTPVNVARAILSDKTKEDAEEKVCIPIMKVRKKK
ncbi:MAG: ABC transporter ATP-binding protein [Lachnospiraceae bacterium]|nr:ABC transporter ATP-binding protein [Lachnospiraceae bacterium]